MDKRLECVVKGRVQMVMFRDFASRTAKNLGILGYVKNMTDGSVYVVAEGEEEQLIKFLAALKKGSFFSKVTGVDEKRMEARGEFKDFKINYD